MTISSLDAFPFLYTFTVFALTLVWLQWLPLPISLSSCPFPLLTLFELSISAPLTHFYSPQPPNPPTICPVGACPRSVSLHPIYFPFPQFSLLLYGSLLLSTLVPFYFSTLAVSFSPCLSLGVTVGCRSAGRLG